MGCGCRYFINNSLVIVHRTSVDVSGEGCVVASNKTYNYLHKYTHVLEVNIKTQRRSRNGVVF